MKITWIGQAGFVFEANNLTILIDPYLSDSVKEVNPCNYRRIPVNESLFDIKPDVMIFTHNHLDHYDPETVEKFLKFVDKVTVLAPTSVWNHVRKFGGSHNYVQFNRHTQWTEGEVRFTAIKAEHSDPSSIGIIINEGGQNYYLTGDTLYNSEIFEDLPNDIYVVFLPINGVGNNMNITDATRFAKVCKAQKVVPMHFGMFDEIDPEEFICEGKVIPKIYEQMEL